MCSRVRVRQPENCLFFGLAENRLTHFVNCGFLCDWIMGSCRVICLVNLDRVRLFLDQVVCFGSLSCMIKSRPLPFCGCLHN